ncbi:transmembrane amino acid transporter protein-domain-containing protein [Hypoxylon trugodes]|uniref:transmembrane amino acid transporter protein-domain-containing protein n=1 Tax=Hypoxylon trugodes TaxID=326681 RepID=UPI00219910B6|nr:transmembrane amino acid transporter protein-domain-containing protein [Hypoxylon trugodes]KAI1393753.1 transmembrane amino acid transporter protein-domain-containing protein [Hypoxylon trugodes]
MKAEYSDEPSNYDIHEASIPTGWSAWFGGPSVKIGPRIAPQIAPIPEVRDSDSELSSDAILNKQLEEEAGHAIQYRTCSWQKTAALLFSEYICLAIMSFPWSYSVLGLVPGLILTVVQALLVLYTSIVLWEFCLRHPEVRDVCDIGQMLFWGQKWAWYFTAFMFILNNTFIQGLHILVGAKYLNTMAGTDADISCQTISFGAIVAVICWLSSLPRTFSMLSKLGTASAVFTFISVILATIFAGIQSHPAGFLAEPTADPTVPFGNPIVTAIPVAGTTFVNGLSAFLNISYTFIGQITLPSFIAEMREPKDFPKALWACTILEIIVFSVVGAVTYAFVGNQYMTAPAFGSLTPLYKKISFSFMIPTLIFLGVLYASVSARFIFFRIFQHSRHKNEHTVVGWATWSGILLITWIVAFIIANSIPFFNSLLSLMSSLFDSFFGFIFWGIAYFRMRKADGAVALVKDRSLRGWFEGILNVIIILTGVFFLSAGTYVSVQGILDEFALGTVGSAWTCASNGI